MTRRYFSSTAQDNTISSGMDATQTSVIMTATLSGWPGTYPFFARIDAGTASEELVLVTAAPSGLTYPVTRAQSGTSGHTHSAGATFKHCAVSIDFDEANAHVNSSTGVHGLAGGDSVAGTIALGQKADDSAVVKLTGNQSISGTKTFNSAPAVPDGSFAQAKVVNLVANLATMVTATATAQTAANAAQATANTGVTNAATAQSTASTANTTANSAVAAWSWTALPFAANISAFGNGYVSPRYGKDAKGVAMCQGVLMSSATITNATLLGTLPSGYRPQSKIQGWASTSTGLVAAVEVATDGTMLAVLPSGSLAAGGAFSFSILFDTVS